jgi:hypothetical protein
MCAITFFTVDSYVATSEFPAQTAMHLNIVPHHATLTLLHHKYAAHHFILIPQYENSCLLLSDDISYQPLIHIICCVQESFVSRRAGTICGTVNLHAL